MDDERKKLIESFKYLPIDRLQAALDAKKNGCSNNMCAAAAGLSHDDLIYMLKLGAGGHRVWQEFYERWRRAEYINTVDVYGKMQEQARNGSSVETFLQIHDEEFVERKKIAQVEPRNGAGKSIGGITINVAKFEAQAPAPMLPDVIDVTPEEIS
jgi:hypothetical protein